MTPTDHPLQLPPQLGPLLTELLHFVRDLDLAADEQDLAGAPQTRLEVELEKPSLLASVQAIGAYSEETQKQVPRRSIDTTGQPPSEVPDSEHTPRVVERPTP